MGNIKISNNAAVLDAIRNSASSAYINAIPNATESGIKNTLEALSSKQQGFWNEFVDALLNRVGIVIVRDKLWDNPLAQFKRESMYWGNTIEEILVGVIQARIYDPDREYLEKEIFGTNAPPVKSYFHQINRQEYFPITVNEDMLRRAFLEDSGLQKFITATMNVPLNSDQIREFELMTKLFAMYEQEDGFYHAKIADVAAPTSTEADAKGALRKIRAVAGNMAYPSIRYNSAKMPTFAKADELILFASPEFEAAIDVEALAGAFNIDRAQVHGRIVTVPKSHFGVDGCQAILTVPDFFVVADTTLRNTSQYNPVSLQTNYFYHHHSVISASRAAPAVMFWTGKDDEVIIVAGTITDVTDIKLEGGVAGPFSGRKGEWLPFEALGVGTAADKSIKWNVKGNTTNHTYITPTGILHIGIDEGAAKLTVVATANWINPADPNAAVISKSAEVTVKND